jgi:hypothetical protein
LALLRSKWHQATFDCGQGPFPGAKLMAKSRTTRATSRATAKPAKTRSTSAKAARPAKTASVGKTAKATRAPRASADLSARTRAGVELDLPSTRVSLTTLKWFSRLDPSTRIVAGALAPLNLRVPVAHANRILQQTVRLVADLPAGSNGHVVWTQGDDELLIVSDRIALTCNEGLITVSLPVKCDEIAREAAVHVAFAVGTAKKNAGLVMSTLSRPVGPALIVGIWGEAITAFAWEALLHLAQQLCGAVGHDEAGRPLIPASMGAQEGVLLISPMARHQLNWRSAT